MDSARKRAQQLILLVLIIFSFALSSIILIGISVKDISKPKETTPVVTLPKPDAINLTGLKPSNVLSDVLYYSDKDIGVVGQIVYGERVCGQRVCAPDDNCCDCEANRDLIIKDKAGGILDQTGEIRLYGVERSPLCEKKARSCDYNCQDWTIGGLYEVTGRFIAVKPYGINISRGYLEYYMEVRDKKFIPVPTASPKRNILEKYLEKYIMPLIKTKMGV